MTSAWYFKEPLRNETQNFLISKLCFPWLVYTLTPSNSTHYYLISSNLPFRTKITKKFPAWRRGWYELFRYSQWQMATDFNPTFQTKYHEVVCPQAATGARGQWQPTSSSPRCSSFGQLLWRMPFVCDGTVFTANSIETPSSHQN